MPLYDGNGNDYPFGTAQQPATELLDAGVLPAVPGLYASDTSAPDIAAIILTHAHIDHYGLAHHAHSAIPVYGSEGTLALLDVSRVFFPGAGIPADLRRVPTDEPLVVGSITITAIPVDHAAPDSRALLVEADGQRILYTGDLRAHGRTGFRFENLLEDPRVRGVDVLLSEGTTLGSSSSHGQRTEADVEESLVGLVTRRPDDLLAVVASGQNLDRLVSCFRAAKRTGRELVIDPYQAYVQMKLAPLSSNLPQIEWDGVRVCFAPHQYDRLKDAGLMSEIYRMREHAKVTTDEIAEHPERFVMLCRSGFGVTKVFDKVGAGSVSLVWSQWSGYWSRDTCAMRKWAEARGVCVEWVHSGGHAWPEDLDRLRKAIAAKETVFVHTEGEARVSPSAEF